MGSAGVASAGGTPWTRRWGVAAAVVVPVLGAAGFLVPWIAGLNEQGSSIASVEVRGTASTQAPAAGGAIEAAEAGASAEAGSGALVPAEADAEVSPDPTPDPLAAARILGELAPRPEGAPGLESTIDWLIPAGAPLESFPLNPSIDEYGGFTCSPEQVAWLIDHAEPDVFTDVVRVQLHNTASSGGAIALMNIRWDGQEVDSTPLVRFECPAAGRGDGLEQTVLLDVDGSAAVWSAPFFGEGEVEGSLVTLNLAAGELLPMVIAPADTVDRQRAYAGRVIAEVADGSGETVILAPEVEFPREFVRGYFVGYGNWAYQDGELRCGRPDPATLENQWVQPLIEPCTIQEALAVVAEAAASVGGSAGSGS